MYLRVCTLPTQAVRRSCLARPEIVLRGLVVVESLLALVADVEAALGLEPGGAVLEVMVVAATEVEAVAEDVGKDQKVCVLACFEDAMGSFELTLGTS